MHTVIYARYSSDLQRDASIEDQVRVCRARADREGWLVHDIYSDRATSGATTLRSGYQALMATLRGGGIDVVLAESLDRFSRDLEHIAGFYKQCMFHQVRIHTVAEGDITELHVGLKGTMGALYLKDLAEKTRRGLEGRVHAGRCTGAPAYGYTVVRNLKEDRELDRGLRAIDLDKAAIVRRIFEAYAGGASPRRIAQTLNAEAIAGPRSGVWFSSTIRGRAKRGDGLLRNELYIGRMVWRRRVNAKDPVSGARIRRDNQPKGHLVIEVPHLRIIDDELWQRVQQRLRSEAAPTGWPQWCSGCVLGSPPTAPLAIRQGRLRALRPAAFFVRSGLPGLQGGRARHLPKSPNHSSGVTGSAGAGCTEPSAHAASVGR